MDLENHEIGEILSQTRCSNQRSNPRQDVQKPGSSQHFKIVINKKRRSAIEIERLFVEGDAVRSKLKLLPRFVNNHINPPTADLVFLGMLHHGMKKT